ncbi:Dipeptide-binding ABC transporter, periplasmic substrate-binding component [Marinobacterium lacunae]|uniref:Dipeptide-binding ABC transporter, periplasmic substrate-binding component n=1 Tax=Marinobacterium lacunae TaxID=1232683 RepID=A0A081G200_9GAMM|nr:ABC transporter substrate-binding protein [Marinobacterium lacunae]KEA64805.1 Dipeptide-binding ABC transporter, periplasmic substrate-binding component [Marinobacterium lacunae]
MIKKLQALLALICLLASAFTATASTRDDIRVGIQLEPPALDPTVTAAAAAGEITYGNVFEGLTMIDGQGQLIPRLASAWSLSSDGLVYTFTLRRDVQFHDGSPFNADVAAYSLRRIIGEGSLNPQKKWFEKISSIETSDRTTLLIHLHQPDSLLPFALALPAAVIVHPDSAATNAAKPIGTGPFRFKSWQKGNRVNLVRNGDYWGKNAILKAASFVFMRSSIGTENMLSEGLIDGLVSVTRATAQFSQRPDYRVIPRRLENKLILAINNGRAPFDNLQVRRALSHAINRNGLLDIYGDDVKPELIGSHLVPSHPAYVDLTKRYAYDPQLAHQMLTDAGVADGRLIKLSLPPTDYGRYGGVRIASDLEAVGFRVELEQVDWKQWLKKVFTDKDYDLTLIMHVEPMDMNIYARDDYYFNYDNTEFKAIWKRVLATRTPHDLNLMLGEAQRKLADDAVNVFLFRRPEENLMHRSLSGFWENSPIPSFVLQDIHWTK